MDFRLSEEHLALKRTARDFAEKVIKPLVKEHDEQEMYPPESVIGQAKEIGLIGATIPDEYGGAGLDNISAVIMTEELSRVCVGFADAILERTFGYELILKYGTAEQKQEYLVPLAKGEKIVSTAITEPDAGSDVANIKTKAEARDNYYIINGEKTFITNGNVASFHLVVVKTAPEQKHRGISIFLVDSDLPGVEARPLKGKLGVRASNTATVTFDDVKVPKDKLLGEVNRGFYYVMDFLGLARLHIAAQALGVAQGALEAAVKYSKKRVQFGNPIFEFQAIQFKLANMATELEAARLLTYKAAALVDETEGGRDKEESRAIAYATSMAKLFASETASRCATEAIQIHGGYGLMKDYPVEKLYRDAKVLEIYEGTSEIQRLVIARHLSEITL